MNVKSAVVSRLTVRTLSGLLVLGMLQGCQITPTPSKTQVIEYRQKLDDTGLASPTVIEAMKASAAIPTGWFPMAMQKTAIYLHQQWRSPTRRTAVGVTYIRLPLPISAKTLAWLAKNEATKRLTEAKIIREWTDSLGREWFEAEDAKYHLTGYAMTSGFDAWINYSGYRVREPQEPAQIQLASKSLETILPLTLMSPYAAEPRAAR
jgi:hypothetical protein